MKSRFQRMENLKVSFEINELILDLIDETSCTFSILEENSELQFGKVILNWELKQSKTTKPPLVFVDDQPVKKQSKKQKEPKKEISKTPMTRKRLAAVSGMSPQLKVSKMDLMKLKEKSMSSKTSLKNQLEEEKKNLDAYIIAPKRKSGLFICQICELGRKKKQVIKKHIETHLLKRGTFKCRQCKASFVWTYRLQKHYVKQHKMTLYAAQKMVKKELKC